LPSRKNRKVAIPHDKTLYKTRHKIENMFARLKDWRRIGDDDAPHRLFVLSTGNTVPVMRMAEWAGQDAYPAEDPSQAWNALSIGGYTDFSTVTDPGYEDWSPLAKVGELSPHSRNSVGCLASPDRQCRE
jgi:hypothetical protein